MYTGFIWLFAPIYIFTKSYLLSQMASRQEDESGGYDVSFVDPLEKDYECPICLLAVRDPVQTPCGHSFCKTCFEEVAE